MRGAHILKEEVMDDARIIPAYAGSAQRQDQTCQE